MFHPIRTVEPKLQYYMFNLCFQCMFYVFSHKPSKNDPLVVALTALTPLATHVSGKVLLQPHDQPKYDNPEHIGNGKSVAGLACSMGMLILLGRQPM